MGELGEIDILRCVRFMYCSSVLLSNSEVEETFRGINLDVLELFVFICIVIFLAFSHFSKKMKKRKEKRQMFD